MSAVSSVVEPVINALRPLQLKGKGFAFDFVTPHSGTRRVKVWGDYEMTLDLSNVIHRQIFMGCFGREMTTWTRALLAPGGRFLDVGANMGYFTLLASRCIGSTGRVYAVEPNPPAYDLLEHHLASNRVANVEPRMIALSQTEGVLRLYVPPESAKRDFNVTMMPRDDWTPVDVPARRLDDCLDEWNVDRIDLMKVDVEGAEPLVFGGGSEHLARGVVRHITVEVNGPRLAEGGSSPAKLFDQLAALGFAPARLAGRRAVPIASSELDMAPMSEHDRLFVHRSAA